MSSLRTPARSPARRVRDACVGMFIGAVVVAGCASPTKGLDEANRPGGTRTVHAANGDIAVPVRPGRVVVLDADLAGSVIDLGVTPVGAPAAVVAANTEGMRTTTPISAEGGGLDFKRIAALDPDLVLGSPTDIGALDGFTRAPVVAVPAPADHVDWRARPRFVADILGLEKQLAGLERDFAARLDRARAAASARSEPLLLLGDAPPAGGRARAGVVYAYGNDTPLGHLLHSELDVPAAPLLARQSGGRTRSLPSTRLPLLRGVGLVLVDESAGGAMVRADVRVAGDAARTVVSTVGLDAGRVLRGDYEMTGYGKVTAILDELGL